MAQGSLWGRRQKLSRCYSTSLFAWHSLTSTRVERERAWAVLSSTGPEGPHCSYFIHTDQLFLSHGGPNRSKQCLSLWIVDVNTHKYWTSNHLVPSRVRCQSTRNVGTLWAALRGMPLDDVSPKDSWTSPGALVHPGITGDIVGINTQTVHVWGGIFTAWSTTSGSHSEFIEP